MNKNKKIIIGILILVLIIVIGVVISYKLIENSVTNRADFKFNVENISSNPVDTENLDESETNNSINEQAEDVTKAIENERFYGSGIIYKIDDDHIYFGNSDSKQYYINRSSFPYVNGRTSKSMNVTDVKVGDYLNEIDKKIVIYRNIFGEELNQELLYNLTLSSNERIMMVNSIEIEEINITNDTAFVKIKYGDIIGDQITDETFETIVEMNSDTKFYSKGNNINSINDLEIAKNNINSIVLNRNTINKKNPAIVNTFESTDN